MHALPHCPYLCTRWAVLLTQLKRVLAYALALVQGHEIVAAVGSVPRLLLRRLPRPAHLKRVSLHTFVQGHDVIAAVASPRTAEATGAERSEGLVGRGCRAREQGQGSCDWSKRKRCGSGPGRCATCKVLIEVLLQL